MNNSRSQRQLLILDCCNSGAFAHGSKSAAGLGKSMGIATAFEGSGFGRVVLTATDATQYAWEGDKVIGDTQKSVFTHFLIEGLKGDADRNSDGRIDVDELYDYAYEQVVRRTPKQTPGKWSYKQQGDIILRENFKPRDVKPAPLPSELIELLSHPNSSVRKVGIKDLISLLDGKHLGLTRGAEEKLREIAANDDSLSMRRVASEALIAHGLSLEQPVLVYSSMEGAKKKEPSLIPREKLKQEKPVVKPTRVVTTLEKSEEKRPTLQVNIRVLGIAGIIIVGLIFIILGGNYLIRNLSALSTPASTAPSLPTLGIGSTMISEKDDMKLVFVPKGEFTMGIDSGDFDEEPEHKVYLNAFWIDKTEVTVRMYDLCVAEGVCKGPANTRSYTHSSYNGNFEYGNYPVIYVYWNMAKIYCGWAGRRLPTEAEWEKAARGDDKRNFPWGNDFPNIDLLNYKRAVGDTTEVGKYPNGASPYGALDMAGNVWEWVADWYSNIYYASYASSPTPNPTGPDSGQYRVLRGGSWDSVSTILRTWNRDNKALGDTSYDVGFRCAMNATP